MGVGAAGAAVATGGGSPKTSAKKPDVIAKAEDNKTKHQDHDHDDDGMDTVDSGMDTVDAGMDHDHDGMDTVDAGMDHDEGGMDTVDAGMDHDHGDMDTVDAGMDHDHGGMDTVDAGMDHDHGDMDTVDAGMDHDHGGMEPEPIPLPETEAEIEAFVAAVIASPEMHIHDAESSKMGEHMAALDLVPRDEATHIAIGHGDWDDPANWHNGEVPGDDARVLIPEGVHMTYDHVNEARLFTLRVDGKLEFSTTVNSQMIVDTIVISPSGTLQIGTEAEPVAPNVNVDIIFANNGAIDTVWDPMLLSRGMIAHGNVEIHGAVKDSHEKVVDDPMAGDTWVDMGATPEGWAVGDTIVIAGTRYEGYQNAWKPDGGYGPPQDEIRVITDIKDGMIFFDDPLEFDHDAPREDLKTSVANYTRNVSFETEDAELAEIYERGHVMFMHNDDVDVRYAEFHELGRTDKSEEARNVDEFESIDFDTNVKGRYSFHFHRAGVDQDGEPGISIGNAVYGSPGWGFVHHDSYALFENNATYDTFGAGYVAESGNETGAWNDNIAIWAEGANGKSPKMGNDIKNFDFGKTGDGFWFQGRMVASSDNIAASVNTGFVYVNRGPDGEDGNITFNSDEFAIPAALYYDPTISSSETPILGFSDNETYAAREGLFVAKSNQVQFHDVHTVLDGFTAWNVKEGATFQYTSHYVIKDFDLIGREAGEVTGDGATGITFWNNTADMAIVDSTFENFDTGINLHKQFTKDGIPDTAHDYVVINPTFIAVDENYVNYDPRLDTILSTDELPMFTPDIEFDTPLTYRESEGADDDGARKVVISGTKTDSLGEIGFPTEADRFTLNRNDVRNVLDEEGYYTTSDSQNYFMLDLYFSDRLTGDIYLEKHPVLLDENVRVGPDGDEIWADVAFNGVQDLGVQGDPTIDSAILWATLTDGQVVLSDEALALEAEDEIQPVDDFI
jgi:hypothetical protein